MTNEELTQLIRNTAPMACELESCHDVENGIRRLIDFAHASVSGKDEIISELESQLLYYQKSLENYEN